MMDVGRIDQQAARLRQARKMRNLRTAKEAAARFNWNYSTYSQHERGQSGITRAAKDYARAYKVSEAWLLTGEGSPEDGMLAEEATDELRDIFNRAATAPIEVQGQIISYAKFVLDKFEKSRETATKPAA